MFKLSIIDAIQDTIPATANSIIAQTATEIRTSLQTRSFSIGDKEIVILPNGSVDLAELHMTENDEDNCLLARISWQDSLAHFEIEITRHGIIYEADAVNEPDDVETQVIALSEITVDLNEFRSRIGMGL